MFPERSQLKLPSRKLNFGTFFCRATWTSECTSQGTTPLASEVLVVIRYRTLKMFGLLFQDGLHNLAGNAIPSKRLRIATWANEPWKTLLHLLPCSLERAGFDVPCFVLIPFWMGNIALPNCRTVTRVPVCNRLLFLGFHAWVSTPTKALVCSHLSLAEQPLMSWRWNKCPQPLLANGTYLKRPRSTGGHIPFWLHIQMV